MNKSAIKKILKKFFPRIFYTSNFDDYFALYDKGSYREAYQVLCDIMENQPRWSKVGDLYVWCANLELLAYDNIYKARELLDKAIELGCHFMESYYSTHGYVIWRAGERDRGIEELEKSIALDPCITNLTTLGKVLTSNDDKHAMSVWRRVLEKAPDNCAAHIYLGRESVKSGDRGKAILMVKKAERLNPTVRDFKEIGSLYRELGQFQNALNAYLEAYHLGYEPKGPLFASISTCYFAIGEKKLAQKYLQWAMRYNPESDYVKTIWQEYKERFGGEKIT